MKVEKIKLDKSQTAWLENEDDDSGMMQSGTPEEIGKLLSQHESKGCKIVFDMYAAPNYPRAWNAAIKRINRIAAAGGVKLSEPKEYFIGGYRQTDKFYLEVL